MPLSRLAERALVGAACGLLGLVGTGGCRGPLEGPIAAAHPDDPTPRRGGVLRLASFGDVSTLDPALAGDSLSVLAIRLLYAGLVDFDIDGNLVPELAERIDVADDGRTYRFPLRQGVTFHDGSELTAADVKRSFDRAVAPDTASPMASFFEGVLRVDVEGRYLVAFHLKAPDATFLPALATVTTRPTCPGTDAPCGAGPFSVMAGEWKRGQEIRVARHERYFRPGLPYLAGVVLELNVPLVSQGYRFARGELDVIRDLTQADTVRFQTDPRWKALGEYEPAHSVTGEVMNVEIPPFDNVEVRRAVAAAIDRDSLALLKSTNLVATGRPIPDGFAGYTSTAKGQTFDLAAAREHMKKAGLEGGWPAPIPYSVFKQSLPSMAGQVIQQSLAKIGIQLEIRETSYPTFLAITRRRGKSAMSAQGQTEDYPDPSDFLEHLFTRDGIADDNTNNYAFYANDTLDALLARARRTTDAKERARLYGEAEQIVCDDAPWAFEYTYRFFHVHQPYVRNYRVPAVWAEDVGELWIDRQGAEDARTASWVLGPIFGGAR
jgi:ABC-type transport system substrate-binding protein